MRSLSFGLVSTFYPPHSFGGDAVHVERLAEGLVRRGHRVRVVHARAAHGLLAPGGPVATPHETPVEVHGDTPGRFGVAATYLTGRPLGYRSRLTELLSDVDVVHFHNPSLLGGPGSFDIGASLRLYTAHEHWLLCPTHVLFRYDKEVCTRRTCWRCTAVAHRPPQLWRSTPLLERSVRELDLVFTPSRFTADLHREAFPEMPLAVLPLPGPAADALKDLPTLPQPRPFFFFAGRLEPIKGARLLAEAFAGVTGADLVIAGDGSERPAIEVLAAANPAIRLRGWRAGADVLALCRDAVAVVVPSPGYETYGGVAVDAMALGTPALVRDLGPLPELVAGGGGLTFASDDELRGQMRRLLDEEGLARRLGEAALVEYHRARTEEKFFRSYFGHLAEVADRRGRHAVADAASSAAAREAA